LLIFLAVRVRYDVPMSSPISLCAPSVSLPKKPHTIHVTLLAGANAKKRNCLALVGGWPASRRSSPAPCKCYHAGGAGTRPAGASQDSTGPNWRRCNPPAAHLEAPPFTAVPSFLAGPTTNERVTAVPSFLAGPAKGAKALSRHRHVRSVATFDADRPPTQMTAQTQKRKKQDSQFDFFPP
jgi:hypothetical protein